MSSARDAFERRARSVRRVIQRHPGLNRPVSTVGFHVWRWYLRLRGGVAAEATFPKVIYVDPGSIDFAVPRSSVAALAGNGSRGCPEGLVRAGSWDLKAFPVSHQKGTDPDARGDHDVDDLHGRSLQEPWAGAVVAIDRVGRIYHVDGSKPLPAHASAQGVLLPALVGVRHKKWARAVLEVRAYAEQRGGRAYQPYLHPDLVDVPSDQGHERFDLILEALPIRSGMLVDLGANSGYFCHRLEEVGFECVAVERSEKEAYFLEKLREASGRRFCVLKGSLTDVALPGHPDVVLALNIFHHFLKSATSYRQLEKFLDRLRARFMLFEPHLPREGQMQGAYRNMAPADFAEWVREKGGFATVREVGHAADGRALYLLTREP